MYLHYDSSSHQQLVRDLPSNQLPPGHKTPSTPLNRPDGQLLFAEAHYIVEPYLATPPPLQFRRCCQTHLNSFPNDCGDSCSLFN
jgi:hypothetical protein